MRNVVRVVPVLVSILALSSLGLGCKKAVLKVADNTAGTGLNDPTHVLGTLARVHFDFDRAVLSEAAREILSRNAKVLLAHPDIHIRVEGHCDDRGSTQYNIALGERRATTVKKYLTNLGARLGRDDP